MPVGNYNTDNQFLYKFVMQPDKKFTQEKGLSVCYVALTDPEGQLN